MLKPYNKAREWATQILKAGKDRDSDSYFIDKYLKPALACGGPALFLMYYYNYSTLTGIIEYRIFFMSMLLINLIIFKQIKKIRKFKNDTAWGKFSDDFIRLGFMIIFSSLLSLFLVWSALSINRFLDGSQPKIIIGEIQARNVERKFLFWTSYKLSLSADIPKMKKWRFAVDEHLFSEMSNRQKVVLMIKDGAFGAPYIAEVKPYNATEGKDEKRQ